MCFGTRSCLNMSYEGSFSLICFLTKYLLLPQRMDGWSPTYRAGRVKVIGRLINLTPFGLAGLEVFLSMFVQTLDRFRAATISLPLLIIGIACRSPDSVEGSVTF